MSKHDNSGKGKTPFLTGGNLQQAARCMGGKTGQRTAVEESKTMIIIIILIIIND